MEEKIYEPGLPPILLFLITWPIYALPALSVLMFVLWREKRCPWVLADLPVAILPWFIWLFVYKSTEDADKLLFDAIVECFVMGCAVPAGLGAILLFKGRAHPHAIRVGVLMSMGLLALAVCTFFFELAAANE